MNFLSHLFLSGNSKYITIGNFIGDFVKGKKMYNFPPSITKGIRLHREIDFFTDNHPLVFKSKEKLRERHGHYSGVVVDVFYDHFLAANWTTYHPQTLDQYADQTYKLLTDNLEQLPQAAQTMLPYMIKDNWLVAYATIDGIDQACKGIGRRTKFKSNLPTASQDLIKYYDEFEDLFKAFFPSVREFSNQFLKNTDSL